MFYYKNTDIAKEFGVSPQAVANWIEKASDGKNGLQVEMVENKFKVIINTHNQLELKRLAEQGKKYHNSTTMAEVEPDSLFYKLYRDWETPRIHGR